ncbi:unnamed protein product, partial [Ectocarpus sp. 12 AP-2014]
MGVWTQFIVRTTTTATRGGSPLWLALTCRRKTARLEDFTAVLPAHRRHRGRGSEALACIHIVVTRKNQKTSWDCNSRQRVVHSSEVTTVADRLSGVPEQQSILTPSPEGTMTRASTANAARRVRSI